MATPIRYADLDIPTSGSQDFIVRRRTPTLPQLLCILVAAVFLSAIMTELDNKTVAGALIMMLAGMVGWYVVMQVQRSRDLLLATEFQNALFASALGLHNKFCLIIKRDGSIIYLDRSFQNMFPDFAKMSRRTIDVLFVHGKVSRPDSEKIFAAVERGVYEKVIFDIRSADKQFHKIIMSIEPILRPSGFILLRGREFIEVRSQNDQGNIELAGKGSTLLNKSTITLFSYVMDTMNMGVYMSGPSGSVIYANPVLEMWLEYREDELTSGNISLQDILYPGGQRTESMELDNYEGEVMLRKKTGPLIKCFINQKVIRDEQNKVMGCTALVHKFAEQDQNAKKKQW